MRNYKKLPICTIAIAAANVLIFLGLSFMGMTEDSAFMMEHGAMYVPYLMNGERYYTLITSMFLHFGFSHLMNNMVMLLVIGYSLEPEIGKIRFLLIYLGSGLMGNLVSAWFDVNQGSYQRVLPEQSLELWEHFFMLQSVIMDESERFQQEDLF